jgi:hypothetical protein
MTARRDMAHKRLYDRERMRRIRAELRARERRESDARLQAVLDDPAASEDDRWAANFFLSMPCLEDLPELPGRARRTA